MCSLPGLRPRDCSTTPAALVSVFFFFNDTATTEIYTLSLHDALPICSTTIRLTPTTPSRPSRRRRAGSGAVSRRRRDRKSTRLNSSHSQISYAVFCLKKNETPPPAALTRTRHTVYT